MADFAAAGAAARASFAHRVGREVIVMHIALAILFVDAVKNLGIAHRAKRCHREHLCLAAGEHGGAVRALEHINLCRQRADLIDAAPIHTLAVIQQPAAHDELLELIQAVVDLIGFLRELLIKFRMNFIVDRQQALIAHALVVRVERCAHIVDGKGLHGLKQLRGRVV